MRGTTGLLIILSMLAGCSGNKKTSRGRKSGTARGPDVKDCRVIQKRNLECIEVLVPMAQRNARLLVEKALKQVDEPDRAQLKARLEKAMASQRAELKQTLTEGLKEPFLKWCTRAHRQATQAKTLNRVKQCLGQPDCQTYATCLGKIMEQIQDELLPRKTESRTTPPATR